MCLFFSLKPPKTPKGKPKKPKVIVYSDTVDIHPPQRVKQPPVQRAPVVAMPHLNNSLYFDPGQHNVTNAFLLNGIDYYCPGVLPTIERRIRHKVQLELDESIQQQNEELKNTMNEDIGGVLEQLKGMEKKMGEAHDLTEAIKKQYESDTKNRDAADIERQRLKDLEVRLEAAKKEGREAGARELAQKQGEAWTVEQRLKDAVKDAVDEEFGAERRRKEEQWQKQEDAWRADQRVKVAVKHAFDEEFGAERRRREEQERIANVLRARESSTSRRSRSHSRRRSSSTTTQQRCGYPPNYGNGRECGHGALPVNPTLQEMLATQVAAQAAAAQAGFHAFHHGPLNDLPGANAHWGPVGGGPGGFAHQRGRHRGNW